MSFHEIIRNRIWQLLNENREDVARLVNLCSSPLYGTAFHANMAVGFMMLNPQNVPALRACDVFRKIADFSEKTDPFIPSKVAKFYLNETVSGIYCSVI